MAFARPTLAEIYGRITADMESRITSGQKIPRVSLLGVLAAVFSGAVWSVYGFLVWLGYQLFPETAEEEFLLNHAARFGLYKKAATYATGQVRFAGVSSTVIAAGTQVQTTGGVIYTTDVSVTINIGGTAVAAITCTIEGSIGNTTASTLSIVAPLVGVSTDAIVTIAPAGGEDTETTEQLRARVIQRTANPPSSGIPSDYERWGMMVPGVGRAWCLPAEMYGGAGTVGLVIATDSLDIVDSDVHADAVAFLETVRPIGAILTVEDITRGEMDYTISITPNTSELQSAITAQLENLHADEAAPGATLYLTHIRAAIMAAGIDNYSITAMALNRVGIAVADVVATGYEILVFRSATYSTLV